MIEFNLKSDVKRLTRKLNAIQRRQVPFATARALTWTAKAAQGDLQAHMPVVFNVTRKWWLAKQPTGIKIKPATKATPIALVYTGAYFAGLQEEGGVKHPFKGRGLLVPTDKVPKYGRRAGGAKKVLAGKKILRRGGVAGGDPIVRMPNGCLGVFRRRGKKRLPIDRLYSFKGEAHIPARMNFRAYAAKMVQREFAKIFEKSLSMAIKSAR
jgi:hypothetical protein